MIDEWFLVKIMSRLWNWKQKIKQGPLDASFAAAG
jgi:hypothetical protein